MSTVLQQTLEMSSSLAKVQAAALLVVLLLLPSFNSTGLTMVALHQVLYRNQSIFL